MKRHFFGALVLSSAMGLVEASWGSEAANPKSAADRAAARTLATEGRNAFRTGDYGRAVDRFRRANALYPAPTLTLYEARALARSGHLMEALDAYDRTAHTSVDSSSPARFQQAVREGESEHAKLSLRIPKFVVRVDRSVSSDPGLSVTIDGKPLSRDALEAETAADPGMHRLVLRSTAGAEVTREFSLTEGETKRVELVLQAAPIARNAERVPVSATFPGPRDERSQSSTRRIAAYGALGVGVAGLTLGVVTGILAASRRDEADRLCPNHVCAEGTSGESALDSFRSFRSVSTTAYVVGIVGMAAGVGVLVFPSPRPDRTALPVHPWIGAGAVGVRGGF
jgi:hypothetical protein